MSIYPSVPVLDATAEAEAKWLTEVLLGRPDCDNFRKLEKLRHRIRVTGIAHRPRLSPPTTPERVQRENAMYGILRFLSEGSDHPYGFAYHTARFLHVGSNPGGFVRYILERSNSSGVGVSLPGDSGGLDRVIPLVDNNRFELCERDLFGLVSDCLASRPLPFTGSEFDFIILDADCVRPRMLVAQLLLALHTICNGGQLLLTFSCIESPLAARVLIALRKIADRVTTSKPPEALARSGLFYIHAETIRDNTPAYRKFKDNLIRLWNQLHTGEFTREITWDEQDLITPWEEAMKKSNVDLIVKLGNRLWATQLSALNRAFHTTD